MKPIGEQNFYEIFDISPRATRQQIDQAYELAKRTYADESLAAYSLFDAQERKEILRRMQLAYETLSDEERRRRYDREVLGLMLISPPPASGAGLLTEGSRGRSEAPPADAPVPEPPPPEKQVRISLSSGVGPTARETPVPGPPFPDRGRETSAPKQAQPLFQQTPAPAGVDPPPAAVSPPPGAGSPPAEAVPEPVFMKAELPDIALLTGASLKEFRERRNVPLQEIANKTRVNITYFDFLEKERYASLPPPVYLRSYVIQYCQVLGLDGPRVAERILSLVDQAQKTKQNNLR